MKIEAPADNALFSDADLQDPLFFSRSLLIKLQNSLLVAAQKLIKCLAENPSEAIFKLRCYEKIVVNFYQLLYWMRPMQALHDVKSRLLLQIEEKETLRNELLELMQELKQGLLETIND